MVKQIILMRHGEAEGNVAFFNQHEPHMVTFLDHVPWREWRLTSAGVKQVQAVGAYLHDADTKLDGREFHDFLHGNTVFAVSPYTRTLETAAHLGVEAVHWQISPLLRERGWGAGEASDVRRRQLPLWEVEERMQRFDRANWRPAAVGETILEAGERLLHAVLWYESRGVDNLFFVTHSEAIVGLRILMENIDLAAYTSNKQAYHLLNAEFLWYRDESKHTPTFHRFNTVRKFRVVETVEGQWEVEAGQWEPFANNSATTVELLNFVNEFPQHLNS